MKWNVILYFVYCHPKISPWLSAMVRLIGMLGNDSGKEEFDGTRHKIILNNFITCPKVWMGRESGKIGDLEGGLWGFFSKEKFEEILKRFPELTYEDFMSNETMPSGLK